MEAWRISTQTFPVFKRINPQFANSSAGQFPTYYPPPNSFPTLEDLPTMSNSAVTGPDLTPFLNSAFSPVDYLNATLPTLPTTSTLPKNSTPSLAALTSQTQSHISQLTALSMRLSTTLTSLTDDILRTSPRLAYEVELLRGEALSLAESLLPTGSLHPSVVRFVPGGLAAPVPSLKNEEAEQPPSSILETVLSLQQPLGTSGEDPPIRQLRTLLHVRSLLIHVSTLFSLALSWPFPPSMTGPSSSLVTISSPPDPALEAKGQAACERLRQEILELLSAAETDEDGRDGVERAKERMRELKECLGIWKGTVEEKGRAKFLDSLDELIQQEEQKRDRAKGRKRGEEATKSLEEINHQGSKASGDPGSVPGFFRNLQRLKEEIYME